MWRDAEVGSRHGNGNRENSVADNRDNRVRRTITAGTLVPSSVNGDIAIQWEWSNFDPSQNPNPLTDYDKTLHN